MRAGIAFASAVSVIAGIACSFVARADGVCNAGYKTIIASDRAAMLGVLEAAQRALPPAPTGWIIGGDETLSVQQTVCGDIWTRPWYYDLTRHYNRIDDQASRDARLREAAAKLKAAQDAKQPRLDAVNARMQELSAKQIAFVEKKDMEHALALNEPMAKLQDEAKRIYEEGDSQAQFEAAAVEIGKDLEMSIQIKVNEGMQMAATGATDFAPPAGAQAATRWTTDMRGDVRATALVLVGGWRVHTPGEWRIVPRPGVTYNRPHAIAVRVDGDAERLDSLIAAIDFKALAALLNP